MKLFKLKRIGLVVLAVLFLTSCKTYSHTFRKIDISNSDVQTETVVVDVLPDFSRKVKASSNKKHKSEKNAKEEAYFNAIIDNNIDVLVDPIYSVSTTKKILFIFGGKSEAEVHGFAGYYKNPRSLSDYNKSEFSQKIENLEKFSKVSNVQKETEEKTYTVNSTCGDCKGNEPLTLISVIKNKESLLDSYEKFESGESNDLGSKTSLDEKLKFKSLNFFGDKKNKKKGNNNQKITPQKRVVKVFGNVLKGFGVAFITVIILAI